METTARNSDLPVSAMAGDAMDFFGMITDVYIRGIDRLGTLEKQALDLAIQQNADAVDIWTKQGKGSAATSGPILFDMVHTIFERCVETQKSVIDMFVEQNRALAVAVKERGAKATKAGEAGVTLGQEAIDQSVAAQKTMLDYSAQQTKVALDMAKKQFGYAGTPAEAAADSVQRGVEIAIDAQKDLLDALKAPMQILH